MVRRKEAIAGWEYGAVVCLTVIAAALRFFRLGSEGVWLDEAFSVWMARLPIADLLAWIVRIDQHPPLYYLLLHGWLRLGDGEAAIRSLSALLSTATVPIFYFTARRLLRSPAVACAAALLLAVSPFHVRFAQEARMYALLTFNVALALLAVAYLLTGDQRRRWWALYVVFAWLTLLTHNTAILFLVAINLAAGVAAWTPRETADGALILPSRRGWLWAQAMVVLLWLPWGAAFVMQARAVDREFWIQPPTLETVTSALETFASAFLPAARRWALLGGLVALGMGVAALRARRRLLWFLLALFLTPFVLELLVSLRRPIFYDRTLIWTTLPLMIVAAAALAPARWKGAGVILGAGAMAVLIAGNLFSLSWYYNSFHKEQWREAAAWVNQRASEDDLLLFNATWVQIPFDYYFARYGRAIAEHGAPVDLFDAGVLEPKMTEDDLPRLQSLASEYDCVYLIYSHDWYTDPNRLIPRALGEAMRVVRSRPFVGLEVQQYARRGTDACAAE